MTLERAVFGRVLLPAAYRITGNGRLRDIPRFLESERWPPERLREHQTRKIRQLLIGAAERVPYFQRLFRSIAFDPREFNDLEMLRQLPPMTRESILADVDAFRDKSFPAEAIRRDATGGSTGTPMEFFHELRYRELAAGAAFRARMWGGWRPGVRTVWIWGAPQETRVWKTLRGRAIGWVSRNLYLDAFTAGDDDMAGWIERIQSFGPEFVYGYASSIAHFALYLRDRQLRVDGIRGVFSTAEKLHPWQRSTIEEAFGAPVYDHYGSREVKALAAQCEEGNMHVLAEMNVIETERSEHESSPILVTCLENRVMPFVRYRIGDVGSLKPGSCPCGRTLPLLNLDIGRETDIFVTPEGRHVHGEYFTHLLYGFAGITSFQFHQVAQDRVVLRVVPKADLSEERRAALLALGDRIRREISPTMNLDVLEVDSIPVGPTGKHRFTVSDVRVSGDARPRVNR